MKKNKLIALILAMTLAVSALTACGAKEEAPAEEPVKEATEEAAAEPEATEESDEITFPLAETMTFTGATILGNDQYPLGETAAWQELEKMGNIKVEFTNFLNSEAHEKLSLLMASGDYPDFVTKIGANYVDYGMDGIYIPLEDMIREYMPNLTAHLDERNAWPVITAADGHIYALPRIQRIAVDGGNAPVLINKAWLDKLGLEEPKSLDELYDVLVAFKTQDPNGNGKADEIPFTFTGFNSWYGLNRFMLHMSDGIHRYKDYTALIDGELVYYPLSDNFKDVYLNFLAKCGEAGVLDPAGFTQTHEQLNAKVTEESIYGMGMQGHTTIAGGGSNKETLALDYITLKPFEEGNLTLDCGIGVGTFCITDKCENPEVLLSWIDYLYTEEGADLACMGVEGVSYEVTADGKGKFIVPKDETAKYTIYSTSAWPGLNDGLYYDQADQPEWKVASEADKQELYSMGTVTYQYKFTEEEQKREAELKVELSSYVQQYTAQVATGQVDLESSWADFQKTIKEMGAEELQTIYKDAYARTLN